jgi:hypothetical protein
MLIGAMAEQLMRAVKEGYLHQAAIKVYLRSSALFHQTDPSAKKMPGTYARQVYSNLSWPRQESNLYLELRRLSYYPLYYEAG